MTEVLVKIVATLVALVLLWFFRHLIVMALSLLQHKFGKGHNVSGRWTATYVKRGTPQQEEAYLRQVLHYVLGSIKNLQVKRIYKVRGTLSANVLSATYDIEKDEDPKRKGDHPKIDCGAFTLLIVPEGNRMLGRYCWMDSETDAPESGEYRWERS